MINTHNGVKEKGIKRINIEDYPAVKKHLDQYFPQLEKRADKGDTPYNLRNCAYIEDFSKQKIVWAETIKEYFDGSKNFPRFSLDSKERLLDKTCFMLLGNDLKVLIGILNSSVIEYFLRQTVVKLGAGSMGLSKMFIEQIPLVNPDINIQNRIENLVNKIEQGKNENLSICENEIDNLVYQLYKLTSDEIEFIESQ